MRKQEEVI